MISRINCFGENGEDEIRCCSTGVRLCQSCQHPRALVSHGFGETRVQNSSKTLVSKKAVALTTLASFI